MDNKGMDEVHKGQYIGITENLARDQMIKMIGSKIISKIFDDNLKDYENA